MTAFATITEATPPHAASEQIERWVEVVSHLDPRHGGLSATVPELAYSVAATNRSLDVSLAAFCLPGEHFRPSGIADGHLSFWPASRLTWTADFFTGNDLHQQLCDYLKHANGVHIHGLWQHSTALAAATARSLGLPYIVSAHGMLEPWALHTKRLKKLLYAQWIERTNVREATCLHALTRPEANYFRSFGATAPIAIIPNAVMCPPHPTPDLFLDRFPELKGKRILLFLGRLHVKKGLEPFLHIWATRAKQHPDVHFVIAGPGADGTRARLERQIARSSLQPSVLLTGMVHDEMKWSALAAAEVFVLPSFSEGLSVSALEAMGMGLPVLITRSCNMPEVSAHEAGWEVDCTPAQLAAALDEALRNSTAHNAAIGANGAALVRRRYSWPIVGAQMAELYRWATGGPAPSSFELLGSTS